MDVLKLLLIDEDAIFRLGLRTGVADLPNFQLVAEAASVPEVWELLENPFLLGSIDLVVLDLEIGGLNLDPPVVLYPQILQRYPQLPLFLLTAQSDPQRLAIAQKAGVRGYCRKGTSWERLFMAFREVAGGRLYWQTLPTQANPLASVEDRRWSSGTKPRFPKWLTDWKVTGLHYIDDDLERITHQLQNAQLSQLDRLILQGRHRELRVASWLVEQILPSPERSPQLPVPQNRFESLNEPPLVLSSPTSVVFSSPDLMSTDVQTLQSILVNNTLAKLQSNLVNFTNEVLEMDIFRAEKRRELLYAVLREVENVLVELRFAEIQLEQLPEKRLDILVDVWQNSTEAFYGKYYTLPLEGQQLEVVSILLQDTEIVRDSMLDKIPAVEELFAHLLYKTPLNVDNLSCSAGSLEGMRRAEHLLQNLMIRVANAVIQPLLEHFSDTQTIKQNFYDRCVLSTREIERFRNDLSWKYRFQQAIAEPKAIYESCYWLLVLDERGIQKLSIYAERRQELEALSGIGQTVTIVLEGRDAIAPRLRSAVSFIGSSLVYVLTQIIGRGLGLIARGVLDSISAVKSSPPSKNSKLKN